MYNSNNGKLVGFVQLPPGQYKRASTSSKSALKDPPKKEISPLEAQFQRVTAELLTRRKPKMDVLHELEQMLIAFHDENKKLEQRLARQEKELTFRIHQLAAQGHELALSNEEQKKELATLYKQLQNAKERERAHDEQLASIVALASKCPA